MEQTHNNIEMIDKSAKSPDFIQNNKLPERKYKASRTKSRNFLSNIAYVGINKDNFYREHFIFDVYLLVTKNLNPFSLDRKLDDKNKYEMIYMLWKECMQQAILRATSTVSLKFTRRRKICKPLWGNSTPPPLPDNYEVIPNKTCVYKQKPIKIDDFNKAEEKEVKERIEKKK